MSGGIERQSAKAQIAVAMRAFEIVFQGIRETSRVTGAEAITVIDLPPIVLRQIFRHEDLFVLRQVLLGQPVVFRVSVNYPFDFAAFVRKPPDRCPMVKVPEI